MHGILAESAEFCRRCDN